MADVLTIKLIFILSMLISAGFAGYLPIIVPAFHNSKKFLTLGNCFAAGIFIITGLAGLLPDSQKSFEKELGHEMPLAYVLASLGYLIILFIENVLFIQTHSIDENEQDLRNKSMVNDEKEAPNSMSTHNSDLEKVKIIPAAILTGALVVHSIIEGIALGLLTSKTNTITLCSGVLIHNIPAAIALGIKMKGIRKWVYGLLMGIFVLSSPLSIAIGIFLSNLAYPGVQGFFLSVSAGTFIYIGCTDILPEEMHADGSKFAKFLAFSFGCIPLGIFFLFF